MDWLASEDQLKNRSIAITKLTGAALAKTRAPGVSPANLIDLVTQRSTSAASVAGDGGKKVVKAEHKSMTGILE